MNKKLYDDQYNQSDEKNMKSSMLWVIFMAPGAIMLWYEYMFPKRGQVLASGRRYGNRTVQVLYSTAFYLGSLFFIVSMFIGQKAEHPKPPQNQISEQYSALSPSRRSNSETISEAPVKSKTENAGIIPQRKLRRVDPDSYAFFDPATGEPRVWYWADADGHYEFFDSQGFHPTTGEALRSVDSSFAINWRKERLNKAKQDASERVGNEQAESERAASDARALEREVSARKEREAAAAREEIERIAAETRVAQEQRAALELKQSKTRFGAMCDDLAGNPSDPRKALNSSGSRYEELKGHFAEALDACRAAIDAAPRELRFKYQYARALGVNDPDQAIPLYKELTRQNYPAAYDNLGNIYIRKKDMRTAISILKSGVKANDPDSMVTMADLVERGYVPAQNPVAAKCALLERAAQLGHSGAQLAVEQMKSELQQQQQQRAFQQQEQKMMLDLFGTILRGVAR